MPLLAIATHDKYVAGAYLVFFTLVLVYAAIMGSKITRIEREVQDLLDMVEDKEKEEVAL